MEIFSQSNHRLRAIILTTGSHLVLFIFFASFTLHTPEKKPDEGTSDKIPQLGIAWGPDQYSTSSVVETSAAKAEQFIVENTSMINSSGDVSPGEDEDEIDEALEKLKGMKGIGTSSRELSEGIYGELPGTEPEGLPTLTTIDAGRTLLSKPEKLTGSEDEGVVVVYIVVNEDGKVVQAVPGQRGSTTQNTALNEQAKRAAMMARFTPMQGVGLQKGTYSFTFTME